MELPLLCEMQLLVDSTITELPEESRERERNTHLLITQKLFL
ncbi:uncharacterized protein G2W53_028895 [Senna tora]|uniref:Uncharacterized protein n=1 Tax=Senna tora TaxID=362788 RepID=A0A834WD81_9FABA|nr:uncharacterized protein G2W53_028895 [Senna tora]